MADKIQMPQSGGGLIRFNEEQTAKFLLNPRTVLIAIIIIVIISLGLNTRFFGLLG